MKIVYHHRTRATDAQRVHILEIVQAFRTLGHSVRIASVVDTEKKHEDASHEAEESRWKRLALKLPFAYESIQLGYNLFALPWLVRILLSERADFIYERYSLFNFAGVCAARLTGRPIVLEVNSPFALEQCEHREIRSARLANWMERRICNMASKVIVVSGPLRRILIANGVRAEKIVLMPNGVNLDHLNTGAIAPVRGKLGLQGKVVIGFVGWFRPWHGLEMLIDAFHDAELAGKGAALMLIGDGPAMKDLKEQVRARNLDNDVVFIGPVSHEDIPPYLKTIDIAVQPAANAYCCPMKIIEYMGAGKAIIAPHQENIRELLTHGVEALLFEPENARALSAAMDRAVSNPALVRELGQNGRNTVETRGLLWERNAARVVELVSANRDPNGSLTERVADVDI
jgi:glycosyltransferase involved in cell wall biosynthesis